MKPELDAAFFDYVDRSAATSAGPIIGELVQALAPASVLDVGCCHGLWVAEWCKRGVTDAVGVDGDYIDRGALLISPSRFIAHDLRLPLRIGRRFDLVQCLEVGEQIPAEQSDLLIESLTAHGDLVLFSSATVGQGGQYHVNEQPADYWIAKFAWLGFDAFDFLRPRIHSCHAIQPWYRYNTFLFANAAGRTHMGTNVASAALPRNSAAPQYASVWWRLRCALLRRVPPPMVEAMARVKHKVYRLRAAKRPR